MRAHLSTVLTVLVFAAASAFAHRRDPARDEMRFRFTEERRPAVNVEPGLGRGKFIELVGAHGRRAQRRGLRRPAVALGGGMNRREPRGRGRLREFYHGNRWLRREPNDNQRKQKQFQPVCHSERSEESNRTSVAIECIEGPFGFFASLRMTNQKKTPLAHEARAGL